MALTKILTEGIKDGEILNVDINASAAIARTKLANVDLVDDTSPQLGGNLDVNTKILYLVIVLMVVLMTFYHLELART